MSVAIGVGTSVFLYMLAILDSIVGFIISIIWFFSLFSKSEGLSWYWFWKSIWVAFLGTIFAVAAIAAAAYTATTAVNNAATTIQLNVQKETQQVPAVPLSTIISK